MYQGVLIRLKSSSETFKKTYTENKQKTFRTPRGMITSNSQSHTHFFMLVNPNYKLQYLNLKV
mgnify:FL=1